ncbi:MAG: beta-propeller fold lactonase family protein [Chloroflexi bacterium]|nr:beta-propeller fold lactonase family protein [Chloroflexota bacterium]MBU1750509.1 beta-propeller fold lactonase family protein [Chloroflexota bacterium]
MKRQITIILSIITLLAVLLGTASLAGATPLYQSGAPTVVSYQGQVLTGTPPTPYSGTGYFKFAVLDETSAVQWSNAPMSGGEPTAAVSLPVNNGLFSVLLGDTSLPNMAALPATAFNGTERYLRVWFSTTGVAGSFTLLSPDRRIAAVPYALQAEEARNAWRLTGNAGTNPTSDFLGTTDAQPLVFKTNGTEWMRLDSSGHLGLGATPLANTALTIKAPDAASRWIQFQDSTGANQWHANYYGGGFNLAETGVADYRLFLQDGGNVGLGTNTPTERLTVRGNAHVLGEDDPAAKGFTSANLDAPFSVYVSGHYAYVVSYLNHRLAIFDVSDPNNIVAQGYTSANLNVPTSVYVSGRYAYVASQGNDRLAIFDVSDPANIVAHGYTDANLDAPDAVYVSGRYAYVTTATNDRLAIFDVSDPANIVAHGYTSANLDNPRSIYVSGRYAYVTSANNDLLVIFDVSDPDNIVAQGTTSANLGGPWSVYVSGRYAYVASLANDRLVIFDVSDPANIVAHGYTDANLDGPDSVYVSGRYAYVASFDNDRLAVFDVSDPDNIVAHGYTDANLDAPRSVYVAGRYAYVASQSNDRLAVFEVNHLETPTLETGNVQSGYLDVTDNAIVGNNLYVQGGLNVGPGGALIGGDLGVQGSLFAHVSVTTVTGDTSLAVTQSGVVLVNNAATITLPAAASAKGVTFTIKRLTAGAVTVNTAGGNIDGLASQSLAAQYDLITVVSDGANWFIIGR